MKPIGRPWKVAQPFSGRHHQEPPHSFDTARYETDLVYQNLLSSVVENAQLAALEITYGVETGRLWHASRTSGAEKASG